jgi:hypothetical protein
MAVRRTTIELDEDLVGAAQAVTGETCVQQSNAQSDNWWPGLMNLPPRGGTGLPSTSPMPVIA